MIVKGKGQLTDIHNGVYMRIFFQKLFKLFYPPLPTCVACGATFTSLYPLAFARLLRPDSLITKPVCSRCDRPLRGGDRDPRRECLGETYYFEQAMAVPFTTVYAELLHSAKYNFRPDLLGRTRHDFGGLGRKRNSIGGD